MKTPRDYIVFPLDVSTLQEAKDYLDLLGPHVGMFKVGLELFTRCGAEIIGHIRRAAEARIFLDLKLHDIPNTVARTMAVIADLGVSYATVHCDTSRMLAAAVDGSRGRVGVLGVTVLTSTSAQELRTAGFARDLWEDASGLVLQRAGRAHAAGCTGVVCSGQEVAMIRQHFGRVFTTVTPGIRPAWGNLSRDDQQRVSTPAQAIGSGSDYLVVGRPIRRAPDPVAAVRRLAADIESALKSSPHSHSRALR